MSFIFYISVVLGLVGLVAAIRPLRRLRLRTRRAGRLLLLGALGLALLALAWPHRLIPSQVSNMQIDRFMPSYDFNEVHSIRVQAPPEQVYRAIQQVTPSEISLLSALFWLRSLGGCADSRAELQGRNTPILNELTAQGFTRLGETPGRELVLGVVGQFWRLRGGTEAVASASEFLEFARPGFVKATINFLVMDAGGGASKVVTETRILATDATARRRFGLYWRLIYPGSMLIRVMWLRAIRQRAEHDSPQERSH